MGFYLELHSRNEIFINGCRKLEEYSVNDIKIQTDKCILTVSGQNLKLGLMSEERIAISGLIDSLNFEDNKNV